MKVFQYIILIVYVLAFSPCQVYASNPEQIRLQESFGNREEKIAIHLIAQQSGLDSVAIYKNLDRDQKAQFLNDYWARHNPLVLKYYYGYHLGQRQYTVSDAFFERGNLIYPFFYREAIAPNKRAITKGAQICQSILDQNPDDVIALCGLGYFKLEQDSTVVAEKLLDKANRKKRRFMEARNGLALALLKKPRQKVKAKQLFEEVVSIDRTYEAALYNVAMAYLATDGQGVFGRFEKVIDKFPDHHDAYFKLGACYERSHQPAKAFKAYVQQLQVNPDHWRARFCAARTAIELLWQGEGWPPIPGIEQALKEDPKRFLPFLGEMYLALKDYDKAHKLYLKFLTLLSPAQQTLYRDISQIVSIAQRKALTKSEGIERSRLIKKFWQDQNPTPTSPANPRELEHYRRVHYALINYAETANPWDRRGETYIRFGPPDHRSWSDHMVLETDPAVVRVKNALNERVQNTPGASRALSDNNLAAISSMGARGRPVFPTDSQSKWESWIYTKIGGGIEINFVDQFNNFHFEYIEVPPLVSNWTFWKMMSPHSVVDYVTSKSPSVYAFEYDGEALDVHYTTADFRTDEKTSGLEIYVGADWSQLGLTVTPDEQNACAQLDWVAVLYDQNMNPIFRDSSQSTGCIPRVSKPTPGTLLIDQIRADVPPGSYLMGLEIRDHNANKLQYFQDSLYVEPYSNTKLALSDIEIASTAGMHEGQTNQFSKGDLTVVPHPSLAFTKNQPVYLYYEIYNLKRDEFGQTHYQIEYTLKGSGKNTAIRILQGLGQLAGLAEQSGEIKMSYDHKGQNTWEPIYIALDNIQASKKNFIEATVQITDLNASDKPAIAKKARFVVND